MRDLGTEGVPAWGKKKKKPYFKLSPKVGGEGKKGTELVETIAIPIEGPWTTEKEALAKDLKGRKKDVGKKNQ